MSVGLDGIQTHLLCALDVLGASFGAYVKQAMVLNTNKAVYPIMDYFEPESQEQR